MCEMVQKPRFTSVGQIARLQAAAMPTTSRVGDPEEDETMASARPVLSRINALGFVTVDSQMGTKGGGGYTHWQRAYVSGFVASSVAKRFVRAMNAADGVLVLAFPHGEEQPEAGKAFAMKRMPRVSLTIEARLDTATSHPLAVAQPFSSMWAALLPELGLRGDGASMKAVAADATQVFVVDMVWGRKTWLFKTVQRCLRDLSTETQ